MNRRHVLKAVLGSSGALVLGYKPAQAAAPTPTPFGSDLKITRVRVFNPANATTLAGPIGLSEIVVAVDTDAGITGYGQGGTPDLLKYAQEDPEADSPDNEETSEGR